MPTTTYTEQEIKEGARLLARMLPLILIGSTMENAGRAVLQRDRELMNRTLADNDLGVALRKRLAKEVYERVREDGALEREDRQKVEEERSRHVRSAATILDAKYQR